MFLIYLARLRGLSIMQQIILASSSQTRKVLMDRLGITYTALSPDIDETPRGETHADQLASRLAYEGAAYCKRLSKCCSDWFGSGCMAYSSARSIYWKAAER